MVKALNFNSVETTKRRNTQAKSRGRRSMATCDPELAIKGGPFATGIYPDLPSGSSFPRYPLTFP